MKILKNVLLATCLASGMGIAERVADPFERHNTNYAVEGPEGHSEVFYVSTNWYDESGEKHDDRFGDLLLLTSLATGVGVIAVGLSESEKNLEFTVQEK